MCLRLTGSTSITGSSLSAGLQSCNALAGLGILLGSPSTLSSDVDGIVHVIGLVRRPVELKYGLTTYDTRVSSLL